MNDDVPSADLAARPGPSLTSQDIELDTDIVIVGAGFAGMYLIHKLRDQRGFDVRAFERAGDVGGTWYWNRYPGARCDIESMFYCYSFDAQLQRDWEWTERFPSQPEILAYSRWVAERLDLRRSIQFETSVTSAVFDDVTTTWTVATDKGEVVRARYLIAAVGCLSTPAMPSVEGLDAFGGEVYHTGAWPHEHVDFRGKRVGVIGTGSSAVQLIPEVAAQADHLTIFQRTAQYCMPARNRPLTEEERQATKAMYPLLNDAARRTAGGYLGEGPIGAGADVDPDALQIELERRWWREGAALTRTLSDTVISLDSNELIAQFVRDKVHQIVTDPDKARILEPKDYPIGTKRNCLGTNFYETFNNDNVDIVSLRASPIEGFTETGLVCGGRTYELDAIIMATGYDAMTGTLTRLGVVGTGGTTLAEAWAEGPQTYLGLAVHRFPNMFIVAGPGSPSVLTNVIVSIEQHVEWIAECLDHLRSTGTTRFEAEKSAQDAWVAHVNDVADRTLYPATASWYMGANIPGKRRVFMPYIGGAHIYRAKCNEVAAAGYSGFTHNASASPAGYVDVR